MVDHQTYVIASDGDLMEGISQEAIALAGHLKLNRLIVLFDDNGISIDGALSLADSRDQVKRFEAAGWAASRSTATIRRRSPAALEKAQTSDKPVLIACKTMIGFGAPTKAGNRRRTARRWAPRKSKARAQRSAGRYAPFDMPDDILCRLAQAGERRRARMPTGASGSPRSMPAKRAEFERRMTRRPAEAGLRRRRARGEADRSPPRRRRSPPARRASSRSRA